MTNWVRKALFAAAGVGLLSLAPQARASVITFDDLSGAGQLSDGYAGVTWNNDWAYYDSSQDPYNPHSGSERVYNYNGDTGARPQDTSFTFNAPVVFDGAWFAGYNFVEVNFDLYYQGNLVGVSGSLAPTATPAYLASGYSGLVDTVVVHDTGYEGLYSYYVMDDVTYNMQAAPEPASLVTAGAGALILLAVRRRRRAS